jgi:septal ring factor EnvC (AmiA/AmiB activator)
MTMTESLETKLARVETKLDAVLSRLENGDANFKEFEKRIATLEKQFYAAALIGTLLWAVVLLWLRTKIGV